MKISKKQLKKIIQESIKNYKKKKFARPGDHPFKDPDVMKLMRRQGIPKDLDDETQKMLIDKITSDANSSEVELNTNQTASLIDAFGGEAAPYMEMEKERNKSREGENTFMFFDDDDIRYETDFNVLLTIMMDHWAQSCLDRAKLFARVNKEKSIIGEFKNTVSSMNLFLSWLMKNHIAILENAIQQVPEKRNSFKLIIDNIGSFFGAEASGYGHQFANKLKPYFIEKLKDVYKYYLPLIKGNQIT